MFPLNRYTKEKLFEAYEKAIFEHGVIYLLLEDDEIEISLENEQEIYEENISVFDSFIKETLENLTEFDNFNQKNLEAESKESKFGEKGFLFKIACIILSEDKIKLYYFGTKVNSSFYSTFVKKNGKWIFVK